MVVTQGATGGSGTHWISDVYTQLTAAGLTDATKVLGMRNHTFQVVLAAKNTNVIFGISGSTDGTSFGEVPLDFTATASAAITANRITLTANGTYIVMIKNTPLHSVKFNFISEAGGAAATLDVTYLGQS